MTTATSLRCEPCRFIDVSRSLRRDRELVFYDAEDLTPSNFYSRPDATRALDGARFVMRLVGPAVS